MQVVSIEILSREAPSKSMKLKAPFRKLVLRRDIPSTRQLKGAMTPDYL